MSKQADETICKLSIILGVFLVYEKENRFARVDIRQAITNGQHAIKHCAEHWPIRVNDVWCRQKWQEFETAVYEAPDEIFQDSCAFACMCERVMSDLDQEYSHNRQRMTLLDPIHAVTAKIHDFCDSVGANFIAYDRSDYLMNKLDQILEAK